MSKSELIRWGGFSSLAAGLVWAISGVLALMYGGEHEPGTMEDYLVEGSFALALLFTVGGMFGLHAVQQDHYGRVGLTGFFLVVIASLAQVVATAVLLAGSDVLEWVIFPVGVLAVLVGFVLFGIATLRAQLLPRWAGWGLIFGLPIAIALGLFGGNILFGLLWMALGRMLMSWRSI
jgi:hypothetical protein